jgi:tyrosine-protein kinase Etk/Wzc
MRDAMPRGDRQLIRLTPPRLSSIDLVRLVRGRWLVVLLFGLGGLGATLTYYCAATKWYEAEILIVPKRNQAGLGSMLALLGKFGLGFRPPHSESERVASILHSRSVTDGIIERFDLERRYDVGSIERTRERLWRHCSTTVQKKAKVVGLRCEDEDPDVARAMSDAFGELADSGFRRISSSSTREERNFLEGRVAEAQRDLDESSRAVRSFQEAHGILDLPAQGKATLSGLASLEGKIISTRLQLSYTRGFASSRESSVAQLQQQIGAIAAQLRGLEDRRGSDPTAGGARGPESSAFPPALQVPELRAELDVLLRQHQVRQELFGFLVGEYETLKAREASELSGFAVLDRAAMPTRHVRPTLRVLPPGFLAGILLGVLFISRQSWSRDLRRLGRH